MIVKDLKYCQNGNQKAAAEEFIQGMRHRLAGEPDGSLSGGISEVGFSINLSSRLANHEKHQESVSVMTLFDACGRYEFAGRYSIQGYAVVRTISPHIAHMAECLVSRIACSYIKWGWGFNANLAGASVHGVNSLKILQVSTDSKGKESWATIEAEASTSGVDEENSRLNEQIAETREAIVEAVEKYAGALESNLQAQRVYHVQFKRLRALMSDEAAATKQG
jgi:hypothetical protein